MLGLTKMGSKYYFRTLEESTVVSLFSDAIYGHGQPPVVREFNKIGAIVYYVTENLTNVSVSKKVW